MTRTIAAASIVLLAITSSAHAAEDPYRDHQWGLSRIGAPAAWTRSTGDGIRIAVVDTGVDLEHPDLAGRLGGGVDLVDRGTAPTDEHGHGTLIAGIIAAAAGNGIGVAGVAPDATIVPVRAIGTDGTGDAGDVAEGIDWSVEAGVDVINLSLADERGQAGGIAGIFGDRRVEEAVARAARAGIVVAIAAGNDPEGGSPAASFQAEDEAVIVVGASTTGDRRAAYSNHGVGMDLLAPGGGSPTDPRDRACVTSNAIVSTWWQAEGGSTYGGSCGTSMATAFVSGVAALLIDRGRTANEAAARIRATVVDLGPQGPDQETGLGRLDAARALGVSASTPSAKPSAEPSAATAPSAIPVVPPPSRASPTRRGPVLPPASRTPTARPSRPGIAPEALPPTPVPLGTGIARLAAVALWGASAIAQWRVRRWLRTRSG